MDNGDGNGFALSGKIMLVSIVILFIVVIIMLCIHVYVRWYLHRARSLRRDPPISRRRSHFVFYVDPAMARAAAAAAAAASRGLDASVIASLPVFTFSPMTHPDPVDCPVCLSEFEDGETGRVLPKCNHTFHTECIDMWFHCHSTCPLCREPVEPPTRPELVVTVCEPEPGSSSGLCEECQLGGEELNRTGPVVSVSPSSSSSNGLVRKPSSLVSISVEVPGRNDDSGCDSPSSSFRSPASRMLSLKRILSRERKATVSPSSGCAVGCSSTTEFDAERGGRVETQ